MTLESAACLNFDIAFSTTKHVSKTKPNEKENEEVNGDKQFTSYVLMTRKSELCCEQATNYLIHLR